MTYEEIQDKIKDNEPDWESFFSDLTNGYAVLQVRNDLPERRDIHFCSYKDVLKYLQREPCRDDYNMLYAEELEKDGIDEIVHLNAGHNKNTALGDYVFEKFNDDGRPGIDEGYYGTSLSMSDVILVKEAEIITALYVDTFGFKELNDFKPYKHLGKEKMKQGEKNEREV